MDRDQRDAYTDHDPPETADQRAAAVLEAHGVAWRGFRLRSGRTVIRLWRGLLACNIILPPGGRGPVDALVVAQEDEDVRDALAAVIGAGAWEELTGGAA